MPTINTLLIANRGEIAVRIIRTARAMGIRTVAVFSDADASAPHVACADMAMRIGAAPPSESYLNMAAILEAAERSGADAVHPGYGFLSENAAFAQSVNDAGLVFVGPEPSAIEAMGDKAKAKRLMIEAGVPCIPGYEGEDQSPDKFMAAAEEIGFPVMVKASAGGGGRGMRVVADAKSLKDALKLARSEAENAFGSGALILEKAVQGARHVEIQVFADAHGGIIHLGERDCSVQRRHQKVIEEAPCPVMTPQLRDQMGGAAIAAANAVDYRGAGTVEFLLDGDGKFYFLEMNTRLQVEHPVTEMATGLDLVELQIRVAMGEKLGLSQDDIAIRGHAIEVRLYAEDPANDFAPSTGKVELWRPPSGEGLRCDAGIVTGSAVTPYYDAMVAKIIACGETREVALRRLGGALENTTLFGPSTNQAFLRAVVSERKFASGEATTSYIDEVFGATGVQASEPTSHDLSVGAVLLFLNAQATAQAAALGVPDELLSWSSVRPMPGIVSFGGRTFSVVSRASEQYSVYEGKTAAEVVIRSVDGDCARVVVDGIPYTYAYLVNGYERIYLQRAAEVFSLENTAGSLDAASSGIAGGDVSAPMHGSLVEILVSVGDAVSPGDRLAVLEAMKMQHQIVAPVAGRVGEIFVKPGAQVAAGVLILSVKTESEHA